jgi:hemolysin III
MAASAAYHTVPGPPKRIKRLRKIDHAAIFMLIAGTYTPLTYNLFTGFWRMGLLMVIWGIAMMGMIAKVFVISSSDWFVVAVYVAAGWISILSMQEILRALPLGAVVWLFSGGLIYTTGAVLSAAKKLDFKPGVFGHHEVWHLFVMGGALCHYILILRYVAHA